MRKSAARSTCLTMPAISCRCSCRTAPPTRSRIEATRPMRNGACGANLCPICGMTSPSDCINANHCCNRASGSTIAQRPLAPMGQAQPHGMFEVSLSTSSSSSSSPATSLSFAGACGARRLLPTGANATSPRVVPPSSASKPATSRARSVHHTGAVAAADDAAAAMSNGAVNIRRSAAAFLVVDTMTVFLSASPLSFPSRFTITSSVRSKRTNNSSGMPPSSVRADKYEYTLARRRAKVEVLSKALPRFVVFEKRMRITAGSNSALYL
mmetsp:Transcript_46998/g.135409  ORF Transcript_46998/g.135409 Transcript_46998/m.135409 type:complete len:268 (-) Transcript_46998:553-1356(-)